VRRERRAETMSITE